MMIASYSYLNWHQYYINYFKNLSAEDWHELQKRRKNGEDITKFLPKLTWEESKHTQKSN